MRLAAPLLAAVLCALSAGQAMGDDRDRDDHPRSARGHANQPGRSDGPARRAQQQNGGGRVLSVEPSDDGHRVKLLKDGEVRVWRCPETSKDCR